jgi:hypothetical protein
LLGNIQKDSVMNFNYNSGNAQLLPKMTVFGLILARVAKIKKRTWVMLAAAFLLFIGLVLWALFALASALFSGAKNVLGQAPQQLSQGVETMTQVAVSAKEKAQAELQARGVTLGSIEQLRLDAETALQAEAQKATAALAALQAQAEAPLANLPNVPSLDSAKAAVTAAAAAGLAELQSASRPVQAEAPSIAVSVPAEASLPAEAE